MNERRQRHVLYRELLFRIVDRELLSSHSKGDASQLLLQILALLVCLSVLFSVPALVFDARWQPQVRLLFGWSIEHFLIATTMLTVGVLGVLQWNSLFPDQRDMSVLAPLPVRTHTVLVARIAATGTVLAAAVLALHIVSSIVWPSRLNAPARSFAIPALTTEPALPPVGAADLQSVLDADITSALRDGSLAADAGGVSIGISTHGTRRVFAYGAATPASVFPVASVTKVFTGLALAQMIERGMTRADEPVRDLIPDIGPVRASIGSRDITLRDLVTHHSGLPGMPAAARDPANPFAGFDVRKLYAFLAARGLARPASTGFRYSNVGFGLLGHALATRAGVDYESLVRELITEPLAMRDTAVVLPPDQHRRLVQGHDRDRQPVRSWDIGSGSAGAGALNSTASDLLTWLEANLHPESATGTLARAIPASHERLAAMSGGGIAFGWFLTPSGDFVHSGDMDGFSAHVWFNPSLERALVVLSNTQRGTSVSADVVAEHIRARLDGLPPLALSDLTIRPSGGVPGWLRLFGAYWLTMLAAGLFIFALIVSVHGIAALLLPHRYFLRLSSALQLAVFCAIVATYFFQPMVVTGSSVLDAQSAPIYMSSPSYWFLGLFQAISGSPALAPLARRALMGLGLVAITAIAVGAVAYVRTLRRLAEESDIAPVVQVARHLPRFGDLINTAIVQFSARTLFRSAPHRVIFTFYLAIGFALSMVFLKTPRAQEMAAATEAGGWDDRSIPLIVSSVVMMVCVVVGARLTFAMPRELAANWIFRLLPLVRGSRYVGARRRALVALAAGPVWLLSAGVFLAEWPWVPAAGHLIVLAVVGSIVVELCLSGTQWIPFACSYLPGRSRAHVSGPVAVVVVLLLTLVIAEAERRALDDAGQYAAIVGTLVVVWIGARIRTTWMADAITAEFEDAPADSVVSLDVWDSRLRVAAAPPRHGLD